MLWYVMFVFSPWDPSTKPINTRCRAQITRGATQTPLCMQLLSLSLEAFQQPCRRQTQHKGEQKVVYWQRCALSHKSQAAALTHPDKEALIGLDTYMIYNSPTTQVLRESRGDLFLRREHASQVNMPRVSQRCWSLGNINSNLP